MGLLSILNMGLPVHGRSKTSDAVGDPVFEAMLVLEIKENTANDQNEQVSCQQKVNK